MIPEKSPLPPFSHNAASREDSPEIQKNGNWMSRSIQWFLAKEESPIVQIWRRIAAFAVLFFISLSILGIILIPDAVDEWQRQSSCQNEGRRASTHSKGMRALKKELDDEKAKVNKTAAVVEEIKVMADSLPSFALNDVWDQVKSKKQVKTDGSFSSDSDTHEPSPEAVPQGIITNGDTKQPPEFNIFDEWMPFF